MNSKKWHRSKTLWFNFAVAMLGVAEANLHLLESVMGPSVYQVLTFSLVMGNAALRFITTDAIKR